MKHITKKNIIGAIAAVTILVVGMRAHAAITYGSFTFDHLLRTSAGIEYSVDLIPGESLIKDGSGRYDLEAVLGYYGTTDPAADPLFESEIRSKINIWYKRKGAPAYEHMLLTYMTTGITTPGVPGRTIVNTMRSSSNGYLVDPGTYTVDAIMYGTTKLVSYEICLPTFTSDTGHSIGSVTCSETSGTPTTTTTPTTTGSSPGTGTSTVALSFTPTSVLAPDTEAKIKGLLKSPTNTTQKVEFWVGLKRSRKGKVLTSDPILITPTGFPLAVTASDLKKKRDYEYGFRISGQTTDFFTGAFSTGVVGDQVMTPSAETSSPTETAPVVTLTFTPTSVMATGTSLNLKGTFKASVETTEKFDLYVWPAGGTPQKIQSSDPIALTPAGFPVTFPPVNGLQTGARYNYRLVAVTSGTTLYENGFSTNVATDQVTDQSGTGLGTDGACGTATTSPQASAPSAPAALCSAGTPGRVDAIATGWTWVCAGKAGGGDTPCVAQSLSSQSGGAFCGSANGTTRSDMPTASSELCSASASMFGSVTINTDGWTWTCESLTGNTQNKCSATKGDNAGQGQNDLPSNFLQNPFKELDSFPKIIAAVVNNIILPIAVPFIGVMIIYSGFLFVVARKKGDVDGYAKAKQTLMYTLIGAALVLGSFVIANALQGTLNSIVSTRYVQPHSVTRV